MINWMQKHKKSLIPTVWISTIAFVGAGFVGWGAYDLNKSRSTSVAKVGDTAISIKEFQNKYSEVYNYLKSISDGKFTDEQGVENISYIFKEKRPTGPVQRIHLAQAPDFGSGSRRNQ